uniref:Uncharacterized protein n=1 Tax=Sphaerodactylus townsendi TaxID=933632 RepID=A0ACB8FF84_9SAUR
MVNPGAHPRQPALAQLNRTEIAKQRLLGVDEQNQKVGPPNGKFGDERETCSVGREGKSATEKITEQLRIPGTQRYVPCKIVKTEQRPTGGNLGMQDRFKQHRW